MRSCLRAELTGAARQEEPDFMQGCRVWHVVAFAKNLSVVWLARHLSCASGSTSEACDATAAYLLEVENFINALI